MAVTGEYAAVVECLMAGGKRKALGGSPALNVKPATLYLAP